MRDSYEVEWVERPDGGEHSMGFPTLELAQSFFYRLKLPDGCWKYLSIERIDESGAYCPELAVGLLFEG